MRFVRHLVRFRRQRPELGQRSYLGDPQVSNGGFRAFHRSRASQSAALTRPAHPCCCLRTVCPSPCQVQWHGVRAMQPDWSPGARLVALTLTHSQPGQSGLYIAFNSSHLPVSRDLVLRLDPASVCPA